MIGSIGCIMSPWFPWGSRGIVRGRRGIGRCVDWDEPK